MYFQTVTHVSWEWGEGGLLQITWNQLLGGAVGDAAHPVPLTVPSSDAPARPSSGLGCHFPNSHPSFANKVRIHPQAQKADFLSFNFTGFLFVELPACDR